MGMTTAATTRCIKARTIRFPALIPVPDRGPRSDTTRATAAAIHRASARRVSRSRKASSPHAPREATRVAITTWLAVTSGASVAPAGRRP